jgi:predicted O-methyltransferase YrrM
LSYQDKNNISGWNPEIPEHKRKWPVGSLFASEGERLYDLVIEHKPKKIIEVGTRYGCSTVHLATACLHNGFGVRTFY